MEIGLCYITAGLVTFIVSLLLGIANVERQYDKLTGRFTKEFLGYFVVGPIFSIFSILVGIIIYIGE